MTRRFAIIWGAVLFVLAAIIFMPLWTLVTGPGVSARTVNGIMWDGSIGDLRVGCIPVGDVNTRLHFLPLLLGRAQISFSRGDAPFAPGVSGSVTHHLVGGMPVDNMKANLPVEKLLSPLPAENLELQDFPARFVVGRCREASGNVRLTLTNILPGLNLSNALLAKPPCDCGQFHCCPL